MPVKVKVITALVASLFVWEAHAAALICKATPWPYEGVTEGGKVSVKERQELLRNLEKMPRQYVYEYFLAEMTAAKPRPNLAYELGTFLRVKFSQSTSGDEKWQLYFELLLSVTGLGGPVPELPLDLKEICLFHDEVSKSTYRRAE